MEQLCEILSLSRHDLEVLDASQRRLLVERFVEGKRYTEMAGRLGIAPQSVEGRVKRAVERVKEAKGVLLPSRTLRVLSVALAFSAGDSAEAQLRYLGRFYTCKEARGIKNLGVANLRDVLRALDQRGLTLRCGCPGECVA